MTSNLKVVVVGGAHSFDFFVQVPAGKDIVAAVTETHAAASKHFDRADIRVEEVSAHGFTVDVVDDSSGFRFRLRHGEKVTAWCGYEGVAFLDGYCVMTQYYVPDIFGLEPMPVASGALYFATAVDETIMDSLIDFERDDNEQDGELDE